MASDDENVFLINNENYLNIASNDCIWIIDSRASFHVTPHRGFFSSYQKRDFGMVKMVVFGDGGDLVILKIDFNPVEDFFFFKNSTKICGYFKFQKLYFNI